MEVRHRKCKPAKCLFLIPRRPAGNRRRRREGEKRSTLPPPGHTVPEVTAKKLKLLVSAAGAALLAVVILQNTGEVETRVLFWSFTMPRALLLFITACFAGATGSAITLWLNHRKR